MTYDGTSSKVWRNSKTPATIAASAHTMTVGFRVGQWQGPVDVFGFGGSVARLIIYDEAISQADAEAALLGLGALYGIVTDVPNVYKPEAYVVDSDVFDPDSSDIMRIRGRNLTALSNIHVGTSTYVTTPAIASHALFDGSNDKLALSVARSALLGGSGWTFSALVDCRALAVDGGSMTNQILFTETAAYMGVEVFKGGARIWQYNSGGTIIFTAVAGGIGNGIHLIQARWTGAFIEIRVDNGEWASTVLTTIGGLGTFRFGCNYNATGAFFKGRMIEAWFSASSLLDVTLDLLSAGVNHKYGLKLGGVAPMIFDPAILPLSGYWKPGDYTSSGVGLWVGAASVGASGGRNLSDISNYPTSVTTTAISIKSFGDMPDFDGVDDNLTTALTVNDLFGTGAFSGWVLIDVDRIIGANGTGTTYANDTVIGTATNAYWVIALKSDGKAYIRGVPVGGGTIELAIDLQGGWNLLQWRCDATDIYFRTNGEDWVSAAFPTMNASSLTETLAFGAIPSYSSNEYNGRMAEVALSTVDIGTKGCDDVLAYVNQAYGIGLGGYAPYAFDPTTLSLSLYCKTGNYVAGTWTGTASAGSSSGRNLTEATNYPAVAPNEVTCRVPTASSASRTLVHGAMPNFDGTNDKLAPAGTLDTYAAASTLSWWVLFYADKTVVNPGAGSHYTSPYLIGDAGTFAFLAYDGAGVTGRVSDGSTFPEVTVTCAPGSWHLAQMKYESSLLYVRVDAGPWSYIATCAAISDLTNVMLMGADYTSALFLDGKIAEVGITDTALSNATFNNIGASLAHEYDIDIGFSPAPFDRSTLSLTGYWKSGNYVAGTWPGTPNAGSPSPPSATEGTNYPSVSTTSIVTQLHPITIVNSRGVSTLTKAVEFMNPGEMVGNIVWYRGDLAVTTDNAGKTSAWDDQSSAGDSNRDLAQATGANRPAILASSKYNGKTVLDFNGSTTWLVSTAWATTYESPMTFHIVHHFDASSGNYLFDDKDATSRVALLFANAAQLYAGNSGVTGWTPTLGPKYSAPFVFESSTVATYYPTRDNVSQGGANAGTNDLSSLTVGARYTHTEGYHDGSIAELSAFDHALSSKERRILRRYTDSYFGRTFI